MSKMSQLSNASWLRRTAGALDSWPVSARLNPPLGQAVVSSLLRVVWLCPKTIIDCAHRHALPLWQMVESLQAANFGLGSLLGTAHKKVCGRAGDQASTRCSFVRVYSQGCERVTSIPREWHGLARARLQPTRPTAHSCTADVSQGQISINILSTSTSFLGVVEYAT